MSAIASRVAELADATAPASRRCNAVFALRSLNTADAERALIDALAMPKYDKSEALVRHEIAFALGQMTSSRATATLAKTLARVDEHGMTRHECAEALGAIGNDDAVEALRIASRDDAREVRETAALALRKLAVARERSGARRGNAKERVGATTTTSDSPFATVDPVPAMSSAIAFDDLREIVMNDDEEMYARYGAMFALRNKSYASAEATRQCADVLGDTLRTSASALLKHEVCYVLGQLQCASASAREALVRCLGDVDEHPMVRHEAAEALGSIADASTEAILRQYLRDDDEIVAQSCEVALEIMRQERDGVVCAADGEEYVVSRGE